MLVNKLEEFGTNVSFHIECKRGVEVGHNVAFSDPFPFSWVISGGVKLHLGFIATVSKGILVYGGGSPEHFII